MLIRYHEPYGNLEEAQHPLPSNWRELASKAGKKPVKFGVVDPGKLYRSGMIWPHHVKWLQESHDIKNLVSLVDGDWLSEFYEDQSIVIHQFPHHQRRELTFERIRDIVDVINSFEDPAIVHCFKGATRTGMVCAGYRIINGMTSNLVAILKNLRFVDVNPSAIREIRHYSR